MPRACPNAAWSWCTRCGRAHAGGHPGGLDIGTALGGVIIIETIFGIPGLGWTAVQAISQQDLPIIVGIVVLAAAFVVLANVLVNIIYALLDPRVRLH